MKKSPEQKQAARAETGREIMTAARMHKARRDAGERGTEEKRLVQVVSDATGVNPDYIAKGTKLLDLERADLVAAVESGELTIVEAYKRLPSSGREYKEMRFADALQTRQPELVGWLKATFAELVSQLQRGDEGRPLAVVLGRVVGNCGEGYLAAGLLTKPGLGLLKRCVKRAATSEKITAADLKKLQRLTA